jgi:hypothetical protein
MHNDETELRDPAYSTEFGWEPLPDNVIPLPRRAADEMV